MSYKANFRTAGPVQVPGRAKVRNLAGMTESQNPNAANPFSSALANTNHTAQQMLPSIIDPRLLSMSNTDFEYPGRNAASRSADRSSTTLQSSCTHETFQRMGAHCQRPSGETTSKTPNPPSRSSTRSVSSESQSHEPSTRHRKRRRLNSDASKHAASVVDPDEKIRWRDDVMEWYDGQDFRWKPARYHRDCRAELIADAAQQAGAPIWTPDMGVDYTSYSPVTQGWNSDPSSVVNSQGRQVFGITTPPENWQVIPPYGPLVHRGCILLDDKDKPVWDIPGLPLTLATSVEGWFLGGLRRCLQIHMKDLVARLPPTRVLKHNRVKPSQRDTSMTQRISRWLEKNKIPEWYPRGKSDKIQEPSTTKSKVQSHEVVSKRRQRRASTARLAVDMRGHAGIRYPLIPEPCTPLGYEYPPPHSNCYFGGEYQGMRRVDGGNHVDLNTPPLEPYYHTGTPFPFGESESLPAIDPFLNYHPSDTEHNLFNAGDFPFNRPRTAADMGSLQHPHDLTHAGYDPWMSAEPSESSMLGDYAEQGCDVQAPLEQTWPYPNVQQVQPGAMDPMLGGMEQWYRDQTYSP